MLQDGFFLSKISSKWLLILIPDSTCTVVVNSSMLPIYTSQMSFQSLLHLWPTFTRNGTRRGGQANCPYYQTSTVVAGRTKSANNIHFWQHIKKHIFLSFRCWFWSFLVNISEVFWRFFGGAVEVGSRLVRCPLPRPQIMGDWKIEQTDPASRDLQPFVSFLLSSSFLPITLWICFHISETCWIA